MGRVEKTVFISYRRTNISWALAVSQNLTSHGYDAFFDFPGIASGDFESVILANIKARAHFVVLLTPSALERCGDQGDWLRREIETALDTNRNIVPLMFEGFDFDNPAIGGQLTGKLAGLKRYNALRVPAEFFAEAMNRVRTNYLNVPLDSVLHPPSLSARQVTETQQVAANAAPKVEEKELTAQEWFERGNARLKKDDLDGAIEDCSEALRLKPDYVNAYVVRGEGRRRKYEYAAAFEDFTEALRLDHNHVNAYIGRGNVRRNKLDHDGAIEDYNEALRLKPDYAEAYYARGIPQLDKGDIDGAIEYFNKALRLKSDHVGAYYVRGNARLKKNDFDGAIEDYREAIRLDNDHVNARSQLAAAFSAKRGRHY